MDDSFADRIALVVEALTGEGKTFRFEFDLAKALGVSDVSLARYKKGIREPDITTLAAFARFGVNVHWLVCGGSPSDMFLPPVSGNAAAARQAWIRIGDLGVELVRLATTHGGTAPEPSPTPSNPTQPAQRAPRKKKGA